MLQQVLRSAVPHPLRAFFVISTPQPHESLLAARGAFSTFTPLMHGPLDLQLLGAKVLHLLRTCAM